MIGHDNQCTVYVFEPIDHWSQQRRDGAAVSDTDKSGRYKNSKTKVALGRRIEL
jgi:hypothetical protein